MGLITNVVEVSLNPMNITYYESKGYKIERRKNCNGIYQYIKGETIKVNVPDLQKGSNVEIECFCDRCGGIKKNITYQVYARHCKEHGTYYCRNCTIIRNTTSFKQWCYDNFTKEKADMIMERWDYEKNKCSPENVTRNSRGFSGKGFWFKCSNNINHKSELKNIGNFTNNSVTYYNIDCKQCNSIAEVCPNIVQYLVNKEEAYIYSFGNKKINLLCKCPICGTEKYQNPYRIYTQGFGCNSCGDGVSYGEKFVGELLNQTGHKTIRQYSKKNAVWCGKYKYDVYLPDINAIVEIHGIQHYEGWGKKISLEKIQENDKIKYDLAIRNGISKYIVIDARYSSPQYLKESILNSDIAKLINADKIDWNKCDANALSSLVKKACDYWNSGIKSSTEIACLMKQSSSGILNYLKKGAKCGLCDYNTEIAKRYGQQKSMKSRRKTI